MREKLIKFLKENKELQTLVIESNTQEMEIVKDGNPFLFYPYLDNPFSIRFTEDEELLITNANFSKDNKGLYVFEKIKKLSKEYYIELICSFAEKEKNNGLIIYLIDPFATKQKDFNF